MNNEERKTFEPKEKVFPDMSQSVKEFKRTEIRTQEESQKDLPQNDELWERLCDMFMSFFE